jgi:glycosyltransferase involved in cell wall biosynthesis
MATVMHTLAEFPPEGWEADLLASHAPGGLWAKWRAYRRARRELKRRCSDPALRPDIVHVHTAADWSWRRKARLICTARHHDVSTVVHFHSGQFHDWLEYGGPKRKTSVRTVLEKENIVGVVLSKHWVEVLNPVIGELMYVPNPVKVPMFDDEVIRKNKQMLILGRNDPV